MDIPDGLFSNDQPLNDLSSYIHTYTPDTSRLFLLMAGSRFTGCMDLSRTSICSITALDTKLDTIICNDIVYQVDCSNSSIRKLILGKSVKYVECPCTKIERLVCPSITKYVYLNDNIYLKSIVLSLDIETVYISNTPNLLTIYFSDYRVKTISICDGDNELYLTSRITRRSMRNVDIIDCTKDGKCIYTQMSIAMGGPESKLDEFYRKNPIAKLTDKLTHPQLYHLAIFQRKCIEYLRRPDGNLAKRIMKQAFNEYQ